MNKINKYIIGVVVGVVTYIFLTEYWEAFKAKVVDLTSSLL
ncbi:hypothetical protein [Flammeovirga sp. SubArs3]|nr:hypothetical protein [Flammeovirga sp. SubArs3]